MKSWTTTVALAALALGGCTLASDFDRFTFDGDTFDPGAACDMQLDIDGFSPHVNNYFEIRLVEPQTDEMPTPRLQARMIYETLGGTNLQAVLPWAVTGRGLAIDFFADFDEDGEFSGQPSDHSWRVAANAVDSLGDGREDRGHCSGDPNSFPHQFNFEDLVEPTTAPGDFNMSFSEMVPRAAFEVRVTEIVDEARPAIGMMPATPDVLRTVGVFRTPEIVSPDFDVEIPGIIEPDLDYRVSFWTDSNGNGLYDPPDMSSGTLVGDEAWQLQTSGTRISTMGIDFMRVTEYFDIGFVTSRVF